MSSVIFRQTLLSVCSFACCRGAPNRIPRWPPEPVSLGKALKLHCSRKERNMRGVEVTLLVVAAALCLSSSRADAQGAVISGDVSGSKALDETNFNFDNSVNTIIQS